jgi:hypothetical protein
MATKNLIPRGSGEGGIGITGTSWGSGVFNSGIFNQSLTVGGDQVALSSDLSSYATTADLSNYATTADLSNYATTADISDSINYAGLTGHIIPDTNAAYDLGNAEYKIRHLFLSDNSLHIGGTTISAGDTLGEIQFPSGITVTKNSIFNGNVGIGTSNPDHNLHISGANPGFKLEGSQPRIWLKENDQTDLNTLIRNNNSVFEIDTVSDDNSLIANRFTILNSNGNVGIGTTAPGAKLDIDGAIHVSGVAMTPDEEGRINFGPSGIMVGQAEVRPDPDNPESIYFQAVPQVKDSEGNAVTVLTADKLGLGTTAVLESAEQDLQFKLLTDQQRFVVGTTGDYGLQSGWYRFNDFKVKGATDIGAHPINPVDTRIYSDESSFVLFKTDTAGNRVAHLVGGNEEVSPNNAIALGIAVKVDNSESPEDIEFVHTDGESYSVINGNSDSVGTNGLPIRQGFQNSSIGSSPAPLLIDGGSF